MFSDDGGLNITIRLEAVTWFRFLQASRAANSLNGGWNSKRHWQKGLKSLSCRGTNFLKEWTEKSLSAKDPEPREAKFMFERNLSKERSLLLNPELLRKGDSLADLSENEINARLYHDIGHSLWGRSIGYEIPLAAESDGQLKLDIFAIGNDKRSLEIIELKKASNTSDSPLMALTEAICYGIQLVRCRKYLLKDKVLKGNFVSAKHFKCIRLILAAPRQYWEHWKWNERLVGSMRNIVDLVNKGLVVQNAELLFDKRSICHLEDALPPRKSVSEMV